MISQYFLIFGLVITNYQLTASQTIRQPIRNIPLEYIENYQPYPYVVNECGPISLSPPPTNAISYPVVATSSAISCPVAGTPNAISCPCQATGNTILITDCSPSACQSLTDTLNLMIVCNLLQNTQGGKDLAVQLATPVMNQFLTSPVLSCGCQNPVVQPNYLPSNIVSPNIVSPNFVTPNFVLPNQISQVITSSPCPCSVPIPEPPSCACAGCPSCQACAQNLVNANSLLSSFLSIL